MTTHPHKKQEQTYHGPLSHPSGIEDEGELAYISMEFWANSDGGNVYVGETENAKFDRLLSFQQGWKACKDFYKINT
jgi:hypothetical protein